MARTVREKLERVDADHKANGARIAEFLVSLKGARS